MPIYEYTCLDCQTRFETLRSIKEADTPIRCLHCESGNTSRQLSRFYAHSQGQTMTQSNSNCNGCHSSSCASCGR